MNIKSTYFIGRHLKHVDKNFVLTAGLEENFEHSILYCPKFHIQRISLIKKLKKTSEQKDININIEEILKKPTTLKSKFITEYLKPCKLKI